MIIVLHICWTTFPAKKSCLILCPWTLKGSRVSAKEGEGINAENKEVFVPRATLRQNTKCKGSRSVGSRILDTNASLKCQVPWVVRLVSSPVQEETSKSLLSRVSTKM